MSDFTPGKYDDFSEELDCGCTIFYNTLDGHLNIRYCPKHGAAAGLLKSCEELVQAMVDYQMEVDTDPPFRHRNMMREARENIAKAKETSDE